MDSMGEMPAELERPWIIDKRDLVARGKVVYNRIKGELEAEHFGEIAAIEPDSGDYFLGEDVVEAVLKARQKHPDKFFYLVRIGFRAVHVFR